MLYISGEICYDIFRNVTIFVRSGGEKMSLMMTARCRAAQALARFDRRMHPMRKQVMESGAGAVFAVRQLLRDRQLQKPLVALGAGELQNGYKLTRALDEGDVPYARFDGLSATPTVAEIELLAQTYLDEQCDCVVALGDGAALDAAKTAAARAVSGGRSVMGLVGFRRLPRRKLPPVIAVPTVAGSGREAMAAALVTDERGSRFFLEDEALMPAVAVLDPELLAETPREKVADAGLDGLCWAIEAFLAAPHGDSRTKNQAAEAAELLFAALESCWNSGGSIRERSDMLAASRMIGRAASAVGGGYARALIRATQTVTGLPFRDACGVILPAVLEKYGNYATEKLALLAALTDVAPDGARDERAAGLISCLRRTVFRLGLPDVLEGVTASQAAEIADLAAATANPRSVSPVVWSAEDCRELILSVCAPEE